MTLEPLLRYWAGLRLGDVVRQCALLVFTAGLLVILQPFGSDRELVPGRLVYWLAMLATGAWIIMPRLCRLLLASPRIASMKLLPGAGLLFLCSSMPMTVVVALVDLTYGVIVTADFGPGPVSAWLSEAARRSGDLLSPTEGLPLLLLALFAKVLAISMLSMGLISVLLAGHWARATDSGHASAAIHPGLKFFARLPPALGTSLVFLRMEDHYVRVVTAAGQTLLLMRLSDAVTELGDYPGVRVHRSWWVALGEVRSIVRSGKKLELVMTEGTRVPVSASYRAVADDALKLKS